MKDPENNPRKEIKELSPALEKLRDQLEFSAPNGYFDALTEQIQIKVHENAGKTFFDFRYLFLRRVALASIVGLLLITSIIFTLEKFRPSHDLAADTEFWTDDYADWYFNTDVFAFYDAIFVLDEETQLYEGDEDEEQLLDYLIDYSIYFLDYEMLEPNGQL